MAKGFVVLVLVAIVASLGSAMFYLVRDREKGGDDKTLKALTLRIGLSVFLFAMLFVFYGLGWIKPHGVFSG